MSLDGQLDWVTKLSLLEAYRERDGLAGTTPSSRSSTSSTTTFVRSGRCTSGWSAPGKVERLVDEADVERGMTEPPDRTRAYFRGQCLARWADSVVAANWDSLILDVGTDPLRRIPMMEPLKGSRAHVEALFAQCSTPGQLVEQLGS